jgi:hypothetical protein
MLDIAATSGDTRNVSGNATRLKEEKSGAGNEEWIKLS